MKSPAPLLPVLFAGLVTIVAGGAMSLQGRANGLLGPILGHSVFAALVSFFIGLTLVGTTLLCSPRSRTGALNLIRLVRTHAMPWWMMLGGLSGGLVVIAQASTVPIMGVAMFTMAFVSGQVTGGLIVDSTRLPPGGKQRLTFFRAFGVLVVIAALIYGASERLTLGVPLWALLLPFVSGALTSVQQAFNGRIKAATGSVIVATTVNFAVGFLALLMAAGVIMLWSDMGRLPGGAHSVVDAAGRGLRRHLHRSDRADGGEARRAAAQPVLSVRKSPRRTPARSPAAHARFPGEHHDGHQRRHGAPRNRDDGYAFIRKSPKTLAPNLSAEIGTRSSTPWNIAGKSRSPVSCSGANP
ncbi:Uncharacterized membrane protein YdcZ, DUF606 family [Brevibacterium antiquum CNRZ 918]|uniref:Uncharacterized membrane protein YdcZ, DUF606 family n=1 Tax=Brevibacterium antiquum CNRZ 918 TaxID=1255637 RepID=A0A2H1HQ50_9MICO|nr:Uncharacterized membrane protein YdcZ, DUF606 family [Brevibacterium antiquum CNRZ 918]